MKKRSYLTYIKDNQVLLVREKNETEYKLPGGRLEQGETIKSALVREVKEEINSDVVEDTIELIANYIYKSPVSSENWDTYIFTAEITGQLKPGRKEIEQTVWFGKDSKVNLKPHTKTHILPILINGGYLK